MSTLTRLDYSPSETTSLPRQRPADETRDVIEVGDRVRAGRTWGTVTRLGYETSAGTPGFLIWLGSCEAFVSAGDAMLIRKSEAWWDRWEAEQEEPAILERTQG